MSYTAPAGDSIELLLGSDYTAPAGGSITLGLGEGYFPPDWSSVDFTWDAAYTPPEWGDVNFDLSATSGGAQTIYGEGFESLVMPSPTYVSWRRYLYPPSFDFSEAFGAVGFIDQAIKNFDFTSGYSPPAWNAVSFAFGGAAGQLYVVGLDAGEWGDTTVELKNRQVYPSSFSSEAFGTATVITQQIVLPSGLAAGSFGTTTIINKNQTVIPSGLDAFQGFGTAWISYLDRTLTPTGMFEVQFGTAALAGGIRELDLSGQGIAATSLGTALVAYKERFLYPQWFAPTNWGYPVVDTDHIVEPSGWDSLEFGTAYIHDNKQYATPTPFTSSTWGTPELTRSPRIVEPVGFVSARDTLPNERWGLPTVWNLDQYVTQLFEVTSGDGGVFGSPIWMTVENRNRTISAYGHRDSAFGTAAIDNKAVPLLPAGLDAAAWGSTLVAYRIRNVYPDGIEPLGFSNYNIVLKTPELFPQGWDGSAFGTPHLENTRRYYNNVGGFDASLYGTAFVAPAVRYVEPYYPYEGTIGTPEVVHNPRYLLPTGWEGAFGLAFVEEHFNIILPSSIIRGAGIGEPWIYNSTPNLFTFGYDHSEWGSAAIRTAWREVAPEGFDAINFPRQLIEYRTKTVVPAGIAASRYGPNTEVRNDTPDPPAAQTIQPTGADMASVGTPALSGNSIYPTGFDASSWGTTWVRLQGAIVSGIVEWAFGTAQVKGPQYVTVQAIKAPDEVDPGHNAGRVDPYTIWCWTDPPAQALANNGGYPYQQMDEDVFTEDHPERPVFGEATVTHKNRSIAPSWLAADSAMGDPTVSLKNRRISPTGLRATKYGIASLNATQYLTCEWPVDALAFGTATIAYREGPDIPRYLYPSGMAGGIGDHRVEFFNREVAPTGIDAIEWGTARVHPPEPIIPAGLDATVWGTTMIDFRIRTVYPSGWDSFTEGYTPGYFADRMRVTRINLFRVAPAGIEATEFGTTTIDQSIRRISGAGAIGQWVIPHGADVRRFNVIALGGFGWDSSIFGDVQKWEAGKIKPQGQTYDEWGQARIDRRMTAAGWDSMLFGDPRMADAVDPNGFDAIAWGLGTITHGDNLDFVCGQSGRAIPPQGWDATTFGTASVT